MAKPDIDNQIEQIRERLIILHREAIFCPKFAQRKARSKTFCLLICAPLILLFPEKDTPDELGPFFSVQPNNLEFTHSRNQETDSLHALDELRYKTLLTIPTVKLRPPNPPSSPEIRYASQKIGFVKPLAKIQYSLAVEKGPAIDTATIKFPHQKSYIKAYSEPDSESLIAEIEDLDETIIAVVDKSDQKLHLFESGIKKYTWVVSTARNGKVTPTGTWNAQWLSKHHKSSIYNNAPMPHSIFYNGNFAIHGTDQVGRLGTPASSGCIRLHPENAEVLFAMVEQVDKSDFAVRVIE